jgi:SRSO17 transposase
MVFKGKHDLALELVAQARNQRLGYAWVGFDGLYGEDPAFLRTLADRGEIFVGDVHKDQRVYLADPKPIVPPPTSKRGRQPTRRQAQTPSIRVDQWAQQQPAEAWQRIALRESTKGTLQVDVLHRRVWLWDGEETEAREWHLLVRREVDTPTQLKYSLSNAPADTPTARLAFMQGQRYWVERALQNAKQDVGLGDYPGRGWRGWHHHMALVMMAMLFMLEERLLHQDTRPLLSGTDIRALLNHFLPRRDTTFEEVLRQMELRHRKRQAGIDSANRKQRLTNAVKPDG